METRDSEPPDDGPDITAAVPLEIDEETAARADDLLRELAEDAGLESALVVDRSGALVAGISSEPEVGVEVISALVAGASGAMRALVERLGGGGALESMHLGGGRLIYLKETVHRFILVAVAEAARPAGLVREKAHSLEGALAEILRDVRPGEPPPDPPASPARSLRAVIAPSFPEEDEEEPIFDDAPEEDEEAIELPCAVGPGIEVAFEPFDALEPFDLLSEWESEDESADLPPPEPKEILEPIDLEETEVVIESAPSSSLHAVPLTAKAFPVVSVPPADDSPFEVDDLEEADETEEEDEVDEDAEDLPVIVVPDSDPAPEEGEGIEGIEEEKKRSIVPPEPPVSLFEADDDDEEEEEDEEAFEGFFEFDEDAGGEEDDEEEDASTAEPDGEEDEETVDEEDEESEIRSSGPFYF